jgi:hypothetical protein
VFLEEGDAIVSLLRTEQRAAENLRGAPFGISMRFTDRLLQA